MPMPTFPLPAECGRVENEADKDDPIDIWLFRYKANRETIDCDPSMHPVSFQGSRRRELS